MERKEPIQADESLIISKGESEKSPQKTQAVEPQVKAVSGQKTVRRKFSRAEKLKIITVFDACVDALERGTFLRKNGLYYSSITKWRKELEGQKTSDSNVKKQKCMQENNQLQRENKRLKKQLAQAEAIIEIQKKVSELLSMNDLNQDTKEV